MASGDGRGPCSFDARGRHGDGPLVNHNAYLAVGWMGGRGDRSFMTVEAVTLFFLDLFFSFFFSLSLFLSMV